MKKVILSGFLALVATVALAALPTPSKIEKAISESRLDDARSMVNEVLKERPDVARARLLNAYILLKKEKDVPAATKELEAVRALDVKGDVVGSPMFSKVDREIKANTVAIAMAAPPVIPKDESGFSFGWILFLAGLAGAGGWYYMKRKGPEPAPAAPYKTESTVTPAASTYKSSYTASPASPSRVIDRPIRRRPPSPPVVNNYYGSGGSGRSSSNFGSTFAGTTAGVVAGAVIADALLHKSPSPSPSYTPPPAPSPSSDSWDPVPSSTSSSSFSDSWSSPSSSSSSSSSDSWSSSSSSSSSSDSWSSSDSSSSSSDSSW